MSHFKWTLYLSCNHKITGRGGTAEHDRAWNSVFSETVCGACNETVEIVRMDGHGTIS